MRKVFFAAFAAFVVLAACNQPSTKTDDQSDKNLAAGRAIGKCFETGNTNAIDSFVADDFVDHTDRGDKMGKDSLKSMIAFIQSNGKDMKMETLSETADKDYVFQWMRYTGTSNGAMGPAGPYDMKVMEVSRFKDEKAVEHWAYMDAAEMMKMMGAMQGAPNAAPANQAAAGDTTKRM